MSENETYVIVRTSVIIANTIILTFPLMLFRSDNAANIHNSMIDVRDISIVMTGRISLKSMACIILFLLIMTQ
jgi:hypothetical protein